jgi:hypothetical protein
MVLHATRPTLPAPSERWTAASAGCSNTYILCRSFLGQAHGRRISFLSASTYDDLLRKASQRWRGQQNHGVVVPCAKNGFTYRGEVGLPGSWSSLNLKW